MSLIQNIKRHLGLEPIEEKLQRFEEIRKAFAESDLQLDELAKDFFIEKSMYEARMKEPDNYIIQPKIQEKFDTFIKGHKESIRKAKKQFDSLKKEKDEIEKAFSNHKYIKKEPDRKGGWNYVYEDEKGKEVKAEMKPWIKERARKITNGYKNPFTGDISNEDEEYAHFVTFATKVSEANKYDSFDELLNNTLKKSLDDNIQSKEQTAYSKIKKAYQHGKISLDSFNTIIKGLTKEGKTKYADFLLFNEEGKLLLLKRSSWEDDNAGAWVIPGGHVDPGEDFKTAAIRELQEESGYNVEDAENVGSYEDGKCHIEYFQAYVNTSEKPLLLQFSEVRDYKWIPINEICEEAMVFNMRDNILKILGIEDQDKHKKIIRKAILEGLIPIEKAVDKYKLKLERLEARRTDKQYTKEEADYVDNFVDGDHMEESSCDRCGYYKPKQKDNCLKVIGKVSHNGHCKFWEYSDTDKSLQIDIEKAYLLGLIPDELIEKAWKKQPVGTVTTRKDGQQYRKVAETGDTDKDWKLIKRDKEGKTDENQSVKQEKKPEGTNTNVTQEDLQHHAKNTSETALQAAVKESADPKVREAAHEELDRRSKEEAIQEEKEGKKSEIKKETKKEEAKFTEKFRELSDSQVEFYLNAPDEEVKKSAKEVLAERGLRTVTQEEYEKGFKDYKNSFRAKYDRDAGKVREYLKKDSDIDRSLGEYIGSLYDRIRDYNSNKEKYKPVMSGNTFKPEYLEQCSKNISKLINDNRIDENMILYRSVQSNNFFESLAIGDIYEDKSFSSTSLVPLKFGNFNIKILAKAGSRVANVNNDDEGEYLIDRDTKFRVVSGSLNNLTVELL